MTTKKTVQLYKKTDALMVFFLIRLTVYFNRFLKFAKCGDRPEAVIPMCLRILKQFKA